MSSVTPNELIRNLTDDNWYGGVAEIIVSSVFNSQPQTNSKKSYVKMTHDIMSVSYTHLDVYKRQVFVTVILKFYDV